VTIPTTTPDETLVRATEFFTQNGGVFGRRASAPSGRSTNRGRPASRRRPSRAGRTTDGRSSFPARRRLRVPVAHSTPDVNAAAPRRGVAGAPRSDSTRFCLLHGREPGIGGGVIGPAAGVVHGLLHPEVGPHADPARPRARSLFRRLPVFHGDCFEGLASGGAIAQRCGASRPRSSATRARSGSSRAEYPRARRQTNVIMILSPPSA